VVETCPICGSQFKRVKMHLIMKHFDDLVKHIDGSNYKCKICGEAIPNATKLLYHVAGHIAQGQA